MSIAKTNNPRVHGALALGFLSVVAFGETGCIRDTDCGICDPDNLILESISGVNYASRKVSLLGPTCTGDNCPGTIEKGSYFVEEIGPCELSDAALASPRGPEEYCKISPLVVAFGLEFIFNNLLEATSVELVRKRPDQPNLFEVYDWKTDIIDIVGPTTRYNGDFSKGGADQADLVTRMVNLSCIDNLADQGTPFNSDSYADPRTNPCNATRVVDGEVWPLKMRRDTPDAKIKSYRGLWTSGSNSCDTPQGSYDTCCSECDFVLSTKVAKYGLDESGNPRTPETALTCTAGQDPYTACRDFVVGTDRSDEERDYRYVWSCTPGEPGCEAEEFKLPWYDKIRETHPDDRPGHLEKFISSCTTSQQCGSVHDLDGTVCIGELPDGSACAMDPENPDCVNGFCRAQWMTSCVANPDTTGGDQGYCVDRRFSDAGAGACYFVRNREFQGQCDIDGQNCRTFNRGDRGTTQLAACDSSGGNNLLSAAECCQESLGAPSDGAACDPFFQEQVRPAPRYGRNANLPEVTRNCICTEAEQSESCRSVVDASCRDADGNIRPDRVGEYAVLFVERRGGVVYDPALKGVEWRAADLGGVPRAGIEACAESRGLVGDRNRHDGWRQNDAFMPESFEDFDRAMCSDSEYTVTFGVPGDREYIVDKVGNTLAGKNQYTFSTPEFHVVPGSGFPTDNLRIGACDDFSLRFSNKYDLSPENLKKIQLVRVDEGDPRDPNDDEILTPNDDCPVVGAPVAGGPNCVDTDAELNGPDGVRDWCKAPCLTVNIKNQPSGNVGIEIDPAEFGAVLGQNVEETSTKATYRMIVPGLANRDQMQDPELYQAAFWDACGMPLILGGASEVDFLYQFSIDPPQCKEDLDQDGIPLSCDNAPNYANPDQLDTDGDGFGDVVDLCPTVPSSSNTADSDKDGVGNDCDSCRQTTNQYNNLANFSADPALRVRNIPFQADTDQDGIGDVCDNCVMVANCESYGENNPYEVGDPIAFSDRNRCQRDDNSDGIGLACETGAQAMLPGSAGPVGFGIMDDFDQDGLVNMIDFCPRQPVDIIMCETSEDCGENRSCEASGICNHLDSDGDRVGDICDTCPFRENQLQIMEGGTQEDDQDGDFVGAVCETSAECAERTDPRPLSFFEVASNGLCCTVLLYEDPETGDLINAQTEQLLRDPDRLPVRRDCVEGDDPDTRTCRKLPDAVAAMPGILTPPEGCDEALMAAGYASPLENPRIGAEDVPSLVEMWDAMCFLPQFDQDFDGLGDRCDLCPFDYDPENLPYVDQNGRVWPKNGAYCNGDYSVENKCAGDDDTTGTDTGTGTGTGTSGGTGVDTGGI